MRPVNRRGGTIHENVNAQPPETANGIVRNEETAMNHSVKSFLAATLTMLSLALALPACDEGSPETCSRSDTTCSEGYACYLNQGDIGECITYGEAAAIVCGGIAGAGCATGFTCVVPDHVFDGDGKCVPVMR